MKKTGISQAIARILAFFDSLAGRIAVVLALGMTIAAIVSLFAAEQARIRDFERVRLDRAALSVADIASRLRRDPAETRALLIADQIWGARFAPPGSRVTSPNPKLTRLLEDRLGAQAHPLGQSATFDWCFAKSQLNVSRRAAGMIDPPQVDCWLIQYDDPAGRRTLLTIDLPSLVAPPSSTLDPLFLVIILAAGVTLALIVARIATAPLRRLTRAAGTFSIALDPEPIPESGPTEVRTALRTFNVMQRRVREGFRERTQILAAISHDLQTPLTRLRLRLEQVQDTALRDRLIADLAATQSLVRDGLDLARSSESREEWSVVDIDSFVASVTEDASEFGADVSFVCGCRLTVRVKPNALVRCLTNLIDNAVKYGGNAELSCRQDQGRLLIEVRDDGPGIPQDRIAEMFDPFVRGESSRSRTTGGTGIGLTIARAQAATFGGTVSLANRADGGLLARLSIDMAPR